MQIVFWTRVAIVAAAHAVLYLAFAANLAPAEIIASLLATAVSTVGIYVFLATGRANFRLRPGDLAQAWRIPAAALRGVPAVILPLLRSAFTGRKIPGAICAAPFNIGSRRRMADAGRRALAATYPTATPNFIALGFIDSQNLIVYHSFTPGKIPPSVRKLDQKKG